ncbi:hypothetical protein BC939DRAFT_474815 [Gamsiella multidivaricata]|uniref:uncharacterized protein n=1 Tax=Gamsiella multidivaricata TaxID=101098 RepID=UPI002220774E|nr:uncharacterized protein BC939DRAFT_474815 [Gamsiella multidivaricata]KAI7828649.1 hypothetical protein BC939DRAFT_474815 [Gamsiella multidivaricata]
MATHTHSPTTEPDPARIQSSDSTPDLPHATSSRFSSSPISTADSFSEETSLQTISTESTPKSETDPEHRETIAATIAGEGGLERTDCGSADSDQGSTTQTASEEDEDEEDEKEEEQFGGDGIQGGRPLLVAQWMASLGTPTDKDYGLHTRTPTRSRRGGRTIDHFARRTTRSTSSRPEPDDLLAYLRKKSDIDTGEEPGDTEGLIFESNKAEFLNEDGDEEEDGDEIPLPKTPSKSRPPLRDLQATMMRESPRTPGSWLDRWKYNIIMTHTTMKPPTILTEKEIDSVEDDDEESTPFEDSTEAGLMTPTRKWTRQPREPDLARLLATDTKAETDETSDDDVEKVNESLGRRMKRSIAEDEDSEQSSTLSCSVGCSAPAHAV